MKLETTKHFTNFCSGKDCSIYGIIKIVKFLLINSLINCVAALMGRRL